MFASRSDLPLAKDATSRFLPWLVAVMVFLATIAMAGAMALEIVVQRWNKDVSGTITVQIMPAPGLPEQSRPETDKRVETAVKVLLTTPGIADAKPLPTEKLNALLEPWLGSADVFEDLPIPRLIDVTVEPLANVDFESLSKRLAEVVPGASVDDHQVWLGKLMRFAYGLELLGASIVTLVSLTTAATVVYATRTSLAVHQPVIEVLHLIGAQDDYLARQFASQSTRLGMKGGFLGVILAMPVLFGVGWLGDRVEGGLVPEITLRPLHWMIIAAIPVVVALLARWTARITVHRTLSRML